MYEESYWSLTCSSFPLQFIHYFDDGFRPVPLTVHTVAFSASSNVFLFEKSLDEKVVDVIRRYSEGKPTLIFCASKRSTQVLASLLMNRTGHIHRQQSQPRRGNMSAEECTVAIAAIVDSNLRNLVRSGFAYHHAGLPPDDRACVEDLFLNGFIHTLCSTSTLAHGVNLPAHLVVIKGTNAWRGGSKGYERTPKSEIIQMIGRAGRPGMDTHGVAVIMTSTQDKSFYEGVTLSADVVESTLPFILTEGLLV